MSGDGVASRDLAANLAADGSVRLRWTCAAADDRPDVLAAESGGEPARRGSDARGPWRPSPGPLPAELTSTDRRLEPKTPLLFPLVSAAEPLTQIALRGMVD
jgi:hypothetical protein